MQQAARISDYPVMTNFHDFHAAILDMDGVITDTARLHARAWKATFDELLESRQEGQPQEPFDIESDYRTYVDGKPRLDGVQSFLGSRGIELPYGEENDGPDRETVWGVGNRKNQRFQELLGSEGVDVFEDALEQIDAWKRDGWKVAVISSSRNCEAILQAAHLLDRFDAKVDGQDLQRLNISGKPAADMFLEAAKRLGVQSAGAIVVEDAVAGIEAGRKGRFGLVVGVARDREGAPLRKAGADCVVRDLRELRTLAWSPPGENCLTSSCSALEHSDWIAGVLKAREPAIFLDYDGTLTPIVLRPEDATLSEGMRSLLRDLSRRTTLAVVSGRDRKDVEQMVGLDEIAYAGSHGFDIRGPGGLEMQQPDAERALPELDAAEIRLRENVAPIAGARVERKRFAIAVHYRELERADDARRVEQAVDEVCEEHPALRKKGGKKIFEVQPNIDWHKGRAVLWLMDALDLDGDKTVALYLGDDETDEDAFRALRRTGAGFGVRVGPPEAQTQAGYFLRDCEEVKRFLESLLATLPKSRPSP